MQEMVKNVYGSLKESSEMISEMRKAYNDLDDKIKSGRYSETAIRGELMPQQETLRRDIRRASEKAIDKAKVFVIDYQEQLKAADNLNPDDITDDVKLFNTGVKLTARDIEAIYARNRGNATMEQLTLRYAEQNGIDLGRDRPIFYGHRIEIQEAENVLSLVERFEQWINTPQALEMLKKYFNVE